MTLQEIINKYEERNKSRVKRLEGNLTEKLRGELMRLYLETEEIINDLKQLL